MNFLVFLGRLFEERNRFPTALAGKDPFVPFPDWLKATLSRLGYSHQQQVLAYAKLALGHDFSLLVPNEVACVESVTRILRGIDETLCPLMTGTATADAFFSRSTRFVQTTIPSPGVLVISVTVEGKPIRGHLGIVGEKGVVYSNDSRTGRWSKNFTTASWWDRYVKRGGLTMKYYKYN